MNSIFLNLAFKQQKNVIEAARASHTVLVMIASSVVKASEHKSVGAHNGQCTTTGLQRMRFKSKYMMLDSSTGPLCDPLVFCRTFCHLTGTYISRVSTKTKFSG
jgi:hypothetical protein